MVNCELGDTARTKKDGFRFVISNSRNCYKCNTTFTQDTSKWVPVVPQSSFGQSWVGAFHNNDSAM